MVDETVTPVVTGDVPDPIFPLVSRVCAEQRQLGNAIARRDMRGIFAAFACDPLVTCALEDARRLFSEMTKNTAAYLGEYDLDSTLI